LPSIRSALSFHKPDILNPIEVIVIKSLDTVQTTGDSDAAIEKDDVAFQRLAPMFKFSGKESGKPTRK
jgi:hypothetical protein